MSNDAQVVASPQSTIKPARRSETVASAAHRLDSITVVGGFHDGTRIQCARGLNCLIGARGTGKTTLLELVRFALDALPDQQSDSAGRRRVDSLIEQNLGGGRVELDIQTKDGLRYRITRSVGEQPMVLNMDGSPTDIRLGTGRLFRADIYSQNEVETIADDPSSQLALIDNFERDQLQDVANEIAGVEQSLATNAGQLLPLRKQIAALTEELGALPEIIEKLKGYAKSAGDADEPVNKAHALKALRDREKRALDGVRQAIAQERQRLEDSAGQLAARTSSLFPADVQVGPNGEIMNGLATALHETSIEIDTLLEEAIGRVDRLAKTVEHLGDDLTTAHSQQELAFQSLIEKHEAARTHAAERSRLERIRNDLLAKERQREELMERRTNLIAERERYAQRLSELRDQRFEIRQAIVRRINDSLEPAIRVSLTQSGNPRPYLDTLIEALRGARLKHNIVAQKLTYAFWPADLVSVMQHRNRDRLIDDAELNAEQADRVIAALADSPVLLALESVDLLDLPRIELRDGDEYKDSTTLSTGQKCTTILPILLMDSDNPLLVDQPEDNLDNRFIFECVVDSIRQTKSRRQLIFVTHNPNIPVLGDAERIFVLQSNGASARVATEGDVDACKEEIVTLLEGGENAFKERRRRYAF
ncbi:MAG: AAA family ATPase [Phycisphaerales bacterium]